MAGAVNASQRPRLLELRVLGSTEPWVALGFQVEPETSGSFARTQIGTTTLVFEDLGETPAIVGWAFEHLAGDGPIDGLDVAKPLGAPAEAPAHPNGATSIDHLVVRSPDISRTQAALAERGFDLRRVREAGTADRPIVQSFYRLGEVILELVGHPDRSEGGPSRFWGLVANVDDIDSLGLGQMVSAPKNAVQPGRRIATVRPEAGLAIPFAFMDDRAAAQH